jgi:P-type conjugative transfer protein TrbG
MKKTKIILLVMTLVCLFVLQTVWADDSQSNGNATTNNTTTTTKSENQSDKVDNLPSKSELDQMQIQVIDKAAENYDDAQLTTKKAVIKNTQDVPDAMQSSALFSYPYIPNQIYRIYCHDERLTDVQMQPGEEILFIGGGDTTRWQVDKDISGSGDNKQWHIYIKPLQVSLKTNFIINTNKHCYHIEAVATNFYTPIISWTYPTEERAAFLRQQAEIQTKQDQITGEFDLEEMNFAYKIDGRKYPWKPVMVFDDGTHTYIQMPGSMKSDEAPAIFIKNGKELQLVNFRVRNGYYIVDRVFAEAEMRVGKDSVRIKRTNYRNPNQEDEHNGH